ncbi:hypothetical protein ACWCSH_48020, partial [Streptosporangium sp. NPDC001682]
PNWTTVTGPRAGGYAPATWAGWKPTARCGSSPWSGPPSQVPSPTAPPPSSEGYVISEKVNPDPEKVIGYWTEHRMEEAEPFPMPMVEGPLDVIEDSSDVPE